MGDDSYKEGLCVGNLLLYTFYFLRYYSSFHLFIIYFIFQILRTTSALFVPPKPKELDR